MFTRLPVYVFTCLLVYLFICLAFYLFTCLCICMLTCLRISMFMCLCVKEKELVEENNCNNFYISDSIGRSRMVQQFWSRSRSRRRRKSRSTVLCIRVGIYYLYYTRSLRCYAPLLLAPAEGLGVLLASRALQVFWGPSSPS